MSETEPILKTKLQIPVRRTGQVSRKRLTSEIDKGVSEDCRIILISASAGYGKTTLTTEWIAGQDKPAAWVSLEAGDSDPVRFWKYVASALLSVEKDLGKSVLHALDAPRMPPLQSVLIRLLNDMTCVTSGLILVLDDFHTITAAQVNDSLAFFIEHLPRNVQIVISTRVDPTLPLARFRARGQLLEIRSKDLKFNTSEINRLISNALNVKLSDEDTDFLEKRTEGWAAGLHLAMLSLRDTTEVSGFIKAFAGDNRYILDYLLEEVLNRQSTEVRNFLLGTSILETFSADLCEAVLMDGLDTRTARDILSNLDATNLFVIPLGHSREWFRYHHLFADLLRYQLIHNPVQGLPQSGTLHHRAACWYESEGYTSLAIDHHLKAGNTSAAMDLVESIAWSMLQSGEHVTVAGWLNSLNESDVLSRPDISLLSAWTLSFMGDMENYDKFVEAARIAWERENNPRLGEVYNFLANTMLVRFESVEGERMARRALELLAPHDDFNRALAYMFLGIAAYFRGDFTASISSLNESERLSLKSGNLYSFSRSFIARIQVYLALGKLQQGEKLCRQFIDTHVDKAFYCGILSHILLSNVMIEQNRLLEANQHLEFALEGIEKTTYDIYFSGAYLLLAWLKHLLGDDETAWKLIERTDSDARELNSPFLKQTILGSKARLSLALGHREDAERWISATGLTLDAEFDPVRQQELVPFFRISMETCAMEKVMAALDKLEKTVVTQNRLGLKLKIMILQALCLDLQGSGQAALEQIEAAVVLGEPEGYIRVFVDEGPAVRALITQIKPIGICIPYVTTLIKAFDTSDEKPLVSRKTGFTPDVEVEKLTAREQEVLSLIASGLSNRDVGKKLFISLNTVKAHLKNLYGKLGVSSRTQAIARAGELRLI